jgi:hypothetical protein
VQHVRIGFFDLPEKSDGGVLHVGLFRRLHLFDLVIHGLEVFQRPGGLFLRRKVLVDQRQQHVKDQAELLAVGGGLEHVLFDAADAGFGPNRSEEPAQIGGVVLDDAAAPGEMQVG